jgi:hypothetical protein
MGHVQPMVEYDGRVRSFPYKQWAGQKLNAQLKSKIYRNLRYYGGLQMDLPFGYD